MRDFWEDFATNSMVTDRAAAAGHPDKGDDRYAYQIGLAIARSKPRTIGNSLPFGST